MESKEQQQQDPKLESQAFEFLVETCEKISSTSKKLQKVQILSEYLKALRTKEDLQISCRLLSGQIFPVGSRLEATVGYACIIAAASQVSDLRNLSLQQLFVKHGDLGKVVQEVVAQKNVSPLLVSPLTLRDIQTSLERIARTRGKDSNKKKIEVLRGLFLHSSPVGAKYIAKFLTREARIGLVEGLLEEAVAKAFETDIEKVRIAQLVLGDIGETAMYAKLGKLESASVRLFHPTNFMLADTMETAEEIFGYYQKPVLAEYKYDGIRVQIHKENQTVEIYSRNLSEIGGCFPELTDAALKTSHNFILDAEVIPWKRETPMPFYMLQTRLRRKDVSEEVMKNVPVICKVYDLLYFDGRVVLSLPLLERRKLLDSEADLVYPLVQSDAFGVNSCQEIQELFQKSKDLGYEGLVVKDPFSPYLPGKRGKHWLKLKEELDTLDVVIVGAEFGHGKRTGVLSDYTFAVKSSGDSTLLTVGKAYSGLTDEEIEWMTKELMKIVQTDDGYYKTVRPAIVLEVAFDAIQRSSRHNSGYALRFPRIKRIRLDKSVKEIDTIEKVEAVYQRQRERENLGL
jgi:DNA ligase-1